MDRSKSRTKINIIVGVWLENSGEEKIVVGLLVGLIWFEGCEWECGKDDAFVEVE